MTEFVKLNGTSIATSIATSIVTSIATPTLASDVTPFAPFVPRVVVIVVAVVGAVVAVVVIVAFARLPRNDRSTTVALMVILAVTDLLNSLIVSRGYDEDFIRLWWMKFVPRLEKVWVSDRLTGFYCYGCLARYYVYYVNHSINVGILVGLSVERFLAVVHPLKLVVRDRSVSRRNAFIYVVAVLTFSLLFNIPHLLEMEIFDSANGTTCYPSHLTLDPEYQNFYLIWSHVILHYILPFFLLLILNFSIVKKMKSSYRFKMAAFHRRPSVKERLHVTVPSLLLTFLFLVLKSPFAGVFLFFALNRKDIPMDSLVLVSHANDVAILFFLLNSAANSLVYASPSRVMRKQIFCCHESSNNKVASRLDEPKSPQLIAARTMQPRIQE